MIKIFNSHLMKDLLMKDHSVKGFYTLGKILCNYCVTCLNDGHFVEGFYT